MIDGVLLLRVFRHGNSIHCLTTSSDPSGGEILNITGSGMTNLKEEFVFERKWQAEKQAKEKNECFKTDLSYN